MEKINVFLSHLTVESKLADALKIHLFHDFLGLVEVFVASDRSSIPVGSKWLAELTRALNEASLQIILCSNESISRPWINFQAGSAHVRGIPIIPFCHSGLMPAQLPVPLSEFEAIEGSGANGLRKLYDRIAEKLGSQVPDVDFQLYAAEVAAFEVEYRKHLLGVMASYEIEPSTETIPNPHVLCISSRQFLELGLKNQLDVVSKAFPAEIAHAQVLNSKDLRVLLTTKQFDIVHIAAYVCPRSGDVYFSDMDLNTGERITSEVDRLTADALASLLKMAKVRLVVITSCQSLVLAAILASVTNVVAAQDLISARMMAAWVESFYSMLPSRSLLESFDFALKASHAPMRLYAPRPNIVFTVKQEQMSTVCG